MTALVELPSAIAAPKPPVASSRDLPALSHRRRATANTSHREIRPAPAASRPTKSAVGPQTNILARDLTEPPRLGELQAPCQSPTNSSIWNTAVSARMTRRLDPVRVDELTVPQDLAISHFPDVRIVDINQLMCQCSISNGIAASALAPQILTVSVKSTSRDGAFTVNPSQCQSSHPLGPDRMPHGP
jgi:hypothetical protein